MAEISRRGAVRKPGSKKGPLKGTGGHSRKALQGKGPTPRAEDRTGHPARARKKLQENRAKHESGRDKRLATRHAHLPHIPADHELIAGRNPVDEAVRAGINIHRVFIADGIVKDDRLAVVVRTATALGAPMIECSRADLDHLTSGAVHQGIVIEIPPFAYQHPDELFDRAFARVANGTSPLIIALDGVTDPHNLGATIRAAEAFGADGVLIPTRRSAPVTAATWKVSAGAAARVAVARATNLVRALEDFKGRGGFVVGLDGAGEESIDTLTLADTPLILVTGAEGAGLSRLVKDTCDQVARIEIESSVESLNAAVATGIALYQITRLRKEQQAKP